MSSFLSGLLAVGLFLAVVALLSVVSWACGVALERATDDLAGELTADPDMAIGRKPPPSVSVQLWSINRWLRWTGVRLCVEFEIPPKVGPGPTRIGLFWYGWSFIRHEPAEGRRP